MLDLRTFEVLWVLAHLNKKKIEMKTESDISYDWEQLFQPDSKSDNGQNLQLLQCFIHNLIVVDMHIKTFHRETLCVGRGCLPVHY